MAQGAQALHIDRIMMYVTGGSGTNGIHAPDLLIPLDTFRCSSKILDAKVQASDAGNPKLDRTAQRSTCLPREGSEWYKSLP